MSASQQNLCVIPPSFTDDKETVKLHVNLPPRPPTPSNFQDPSSGYPITSSLPTGKDHQDQNPFFFGHLTDNYVNSDYFSRRYNPENFKKEDNSPAKVQQDDPGKICFIFATLSKVFFLAGSKQEEVHKHHHTPVENEENIKLKTSNPSPDGKETKQDKKPKSPKMSITKKVSIHFKGKKEKERLKKLVLDGNPDIRLRERKSSIFEWKLVFVVNCSVFIWGLFVGITGKWSKSRQPQNQNPANMDFTRKHPVSNLKSPRLKPLTTLNRKLPTPRRARRKKKQKRKRRRAGKASLLVLIGQGMFI